jgi:hypothetical protein
MDELHKIRKAFPEQPGPSAEVTQQARRQVQALVREAESTRRRDRWYAAAKAGRVGIALTATAATVALAALATPLFFSPGTGPDAGPVPSTITPTPHLVTASQVLLATAVQQERNEKVSGKYYRVRSLQLRGNTEVGSPKYKLERPSITESWMPMKQGVQSWFGWVDLGARPATPADVAKWKKQGSPTSWQLSYEVDPVTMKANEPTVRKMTFDEVPPGYYLSGVKPVTAQQIQALPTDPVKLRALLAKGAEPGSSEENVNFTVFQAAGRLLFEMPSPPKLRGAALRVLSMLPGTQYKENAKDALGRTGTRITMTWSKALGREPGGSPTVSDGIGTSYIIDPATGRLLSSESVGLKTGASVVLESGWTDERPTPPSKALR